MRIEIGNRLALERAWLAVQAEFVKTGYLDMSWHGERRQLSQNALYWVWCRQVATEEDQGRTEDDIDADVKLAKGFEVLRSGDHEWDELLAKTLDKWLHKGRYEDAHDLAKAMQCTSLMDKKQMAQVLDWMQMHYAQNAGIMLEVKK